MPDETLYVKCDCGHEVFEDYTIVRTEGDVVTWQGAIRCQSCGAYWPFGGEKVREGDEQ